LRTPEDGCINIRNTLSNK